MSEEVALLFPGQGAQSVGMGRAAYERSAAARAVFAAADDALAYPLSRLVFEGPDEELRATRHQQPAILVTSLALLAAHDEQDGPFPVACATGHSLGLYSALVAAGALGLEDAVRLVARRGALMQRAGDEQPSGMVAVLGLDDAVVEEVCAEVSQAAPIAGMAEGAAPDDAAVAVPGAGGGVVAVADDDRPAVRHRYVAVPGAGGVVVAANYNAPGQVVVSGARDALERAMELLKARGARKVVPLAVSGAFHSPLMRSAAAALAPALHEAALRDPAYPIIANATARVLSTAEEIRVELLGQILAPVRWSDAVRRIAASGVRAFVDCGPGATLAGLLKRIVPGATIIRLDGGE